MAEAKGVTPKRGPGPKGGIPQGQEKRLRVSMATYQGLVGIAGALSPAYGREVSIGEAMAVAIERFRKALASKAGKDAILARAAETPRETIPLGEENAIHVSPATYAAFLAVSGRILPAFGRRPSSGEVGAFIVRYYQEQETKEVSA